MLFLFFQGVRKMRQEIGRYRCRGDIAGREYVVIEYQNMVPFNGLEGGVQYRGGTKGLELVGGGNLNFIDENTFEIVQTGEIVRRI